MTLNDLERFEWTFYVKFLLLRTDFESIIYLFLLIYCRVCLHAGDKQRLAKGIANRDPQSIWSPRKTADLS